MYLNVLVLQKHSYMYKTYSYYPQLLILLFILQHYRTFNVMFIFPTLLVLNKFAATLIIQH